MKAIALALLVAAPAAQAGPDDWRGAYGGIAFGGASARSTWTTDAATGTLDETVEHTKGAPMGGLQFGYRAAPAGALRLGVEFAGYAARIEKNSTSTAAGAVNQERITRINDPLSLVVQAGFAGSSVLAYARGGLAYSRVELKAINHTTGNTAAWDEDAFGWIAGAGLEFRLHKAWSVGVQYDYSKLKINDATTLASGGTLAQVTDFSTRLHSVLMRLNYNY